MRLTPEADGTRPSRAKDRADEAERGLTAPTADSSELNWPKDSADNKEPVTEPKTKSIQSKWVWPYVERMGSVRM